MSNYGSTPPPPPPPLGGYQQPGYGAASSGAPLASWLPRVGAYLVDYALVLPFFIMYLVFSPKTVTTTVNDTTNTSVSEGNQGLALLMLLFVVAIWVYSRCYLGGQGQSLGKKVLGLTLVADSTGQPIGAGKALLRDLLHFLDAISCFVGFLFPLWDQKRQTFADKILTAVVTTRA